MKCFNCGKELPDNARFCSGCGEEQGFSAELLLRAQMGEQEALSELYRRTCSAAYKTAAVLIKDEDVVMDILQDSYVKAFRNLHQLREPDKFRAWMKRIIHNGAVDWLRKRKPEVFSEMSYDSEGTVDIPDDRICSLPEAVIDRNETARIMGEILDGLSPDHRAVIVMYYYEQMTVKNIAAELGVNENTVKSRLLHGRKNIEAAVRRLEKQGTKLYGLAPIPFLLFLFRSWEVQAAPVPDPGVLSSVLQACGTLSPFADPPVGPGAEASGSAGTASAARAASGAGSAGTAAASGAAAGAAGTAGIAAGAVGKGVAVKVLIGILALGAVGGGAGAVIYHNSQKEKEESPANIPEETDTREEEEEILELLEGKWEAHVQDSGENYIMTLDFETNGQAEYMTGWEQSDAALLSDGTYTVEGDMLHMTFEENQVSGARIDWECTYRIAIEDEMLEMEYMSGDSINRFQEAGDIFYYSRPGDIQTEADPGEAPSDDTFTLTEADQMLIRERLGVPEDAVVEFEIGEEYYWEGAGMTVVPISIYENGEYVAGADIDKVSMEPVTSIMSYQK